MARVVKNGKSSLPGRVLKLSFPDDDTLAFWKATEDGPDEYAARVARFSKALGKEQPSTAPLPPVCRLRDFATARRSHRALARVLVMPMKFDLDSRSFARAVGRNTRSVGGNMNTKAPGVAARKTGTVLKRGAATQVMTYPRPRTKKVLVGAARDVNRPLSSFMILSSLAEAARLRGCEIADLIPPEELQQYRTSRVHQNRSAAAKRAWATIRAKRT